jgi:hypothetical protein
MKKGERWKLFLYCRFLAWYSPGEKSGLPPINAIAVPVFFLTIKVESYQAALARE